MTSKVELKKQLIVLSIILILVIIVAILLNIENKKNINNEVKNVSNNNITDEHNNKQEMLNNLKGLLEETEANEEAYIQDETQGTTNKVITTENGETIIVRE